jgi:hypothetical protein
MESGAPICGKPAIFPMEPWILLTAAKAAAGLFSPFAMQSPICSKSLKAALEYLILAKMPRLKLRAHLIGRNPAFLIAGFPHLAQF